ncbi:DUF488 domain-containing protein [Spiribacter halobius]|nr:DUF488 domain-containing protein [Spiribacter halobius]UEX79716.1 DUF488 domain-containing protein [Spiribacter halobius]
MSADILLKRVRDPVEEGDGTRVLVDRVWPRGVRKADAAVDRWLKEVAPSTELRKWFGHDPERWAEFRRRYRRELADVPEALRELMALCRRGPVTLLFGARDREHNQAVVLREVLREELAAEDEPREPASPVCYADQFPQR